MISEEEVAKREWTEQERLELAAKLDADLDAFIDSLEKKRYEEGWPEDRWQEVCSIQYKVTLLNADSDF